MTDKVSFLRHSAWITSEDFTEAITIIGCGAVGSNMALNLAKMGVTKFKLWDLDIVEAHNLPNQAYMPKHIHQPKVDALKDVLQEFNPDIEVTTFKEFFTEDKKEELTASVVVATDSMSSRKEIYKSVQDSFNVTYLFETRLGFDYGEFHIVTVANLEELENWYNSLGNDEDIPEGPCNQRICTTLVNLICAYGTHMICNANRSFNRDLTFEYNKQSVFSLSQHLDFYKL